MYVDTKKVSGIFSIAFVIAGLLNISNSLTNNYDSYAQSVKFHSTDNLIFKLNNADINPLFPLKLEYELDSISTNATDLQSMKVDESSLSWVSVTDTDVFISTGFYVPLPNNPKESSVVDYSSFIDVKSIEVREDGTRVYELERTVGTDNIGDHYIINGSLTQTSDNEAILFLNLSP